MGSRPTDINSLQKDYLKGEIESIEQIEPNSPTSPFKVKLGQDFESLVVIDQSPNLVTPGGPNDKGRFENGKLSINAPDDVNNDGSYVGVVGKWK